MSSGSWELRGAEPVWWFLDAPAARFRRRATCHSSPLSAIYCYLTVLSLTSIRVHMWGQEVFFPCKTWHECYWLVSSFLTHTLLRLRLVNSIVNALAPPSAAESDTTVVNSLCRPFSKQHRNKYIQQNDNKINEYNEIKETGVQDLFFLFEFDVLARILISWPTSVTVGGGNVPSTLP